MLSLITQRNLLRGTSVSPTRRNSHVLIRSYNYTGKKIMLVVFSLKHGTLLHVACLVCQSTFTSYSVE